MTKRLYPIGLLCVFISSFQLQAQLKDPELSISVMPTVSNRFMTFRNEVAQHYKDSINKADAWRDALGAAVTLSFSTSKDTRIHFGLQYLNLGFTRKKEELKFLDTIHPQIGIISDLSQTGGAYVEFNYVYHYISLPFLFSKQIKTGNMKESVLHFLVGGSVNCLLHHEIRTKLRGFTNQGKNTFVLNADDQEAGRINANLQIGFRLDNLIYGKNTFAFVQPNIIFPILNANYSKERAHLYALGVQVGLMFKLDKDKA